MEERPMNRLKRILSSQECAITIECLLIAGLFAIIATAGLRVFEL
jgi:hypothetical protein